jgi:hypothetical protein
VAKTGQGEKEDPMARKINFEFDVILEPGDHPSHPGRYDLTVYRDGHGWTTADLNIAMLIVIRNKINHLLDNELLVASRAQDDARARYAAEAVEVEVKRVPRNG